MSSTWNGSALRTRLAQKYGLTDATSLARMLEWINEIVIDICSVYKWPFLLFKLKKQIISGEQEIDFSPQIPSAPTLALLAGGSLTADSPVYLKVTFVLFDESGKEYSSIESEASVASNTVTPTGGNLSLTVTGIDTYDGDTAVKPTTIHRRLFLKSGSGDYVLNKTLADNTTVTTTITAVGTSTIEPPEESMVDLVDGAPLIEGSGITLYEKDFDEIKRCDPNLSATGTPQYFSRISNNKIFLYPRPTSTYTLSYWVKRKPSRIFADTDRPIQMPESFKPILDAGTTWKGYEYKDSDGQETKKANYERLRDDAMGTKGTTGSQAKTVRRVC